MDETKKKLLTESIVIRNYGTELQNEKIPKSELTSIPYYKLFQYSTLFDKFLILIAVIFSLLSSVSYTILSLTVGTATGAIVAHAYSTSDTNGTSPELKELAGETLMDEMFEFVVTNCVAAVVILISTYISTVLFNYSALRQIFRIRELFFSSVLNQDISWYDQNQTGDFSSRIADDLKKLEEGLGERFGVVVYYEGIFVASLILALVQGWKLALLCMASIPVTMISIGLISWVSSKFAKQESEAYGEAGSIAEETLTSIRTVVAFGGQAKEETRYNDLLLSAKNNNIRKTFLNGVSSAVMWLFTYGGYALAFSYGVMLILQDREQPADQVTYKAGNVITILFSILTAQCFFGMAAPHVETLGVAQGAAAKIFQVIHAQPVINESKGKGKKPKKMDGKITFKEVSFNYPSRKHVKILRRFNLTIKSGETVALVGSSGCGKSTCIQLLQRFYDPDFGSVYIDNNRIPDLDLDCLRSYIGVVGQEPVLFETTIYENIRYGYLDATQEEIEAAAKKANAHIFITALPRGYSTIIGERGAQLSGGQKQRIAIARALVREPAILLLDEATSALDTKSEALVQSALDAASHGCTTVIVAHRLSTVRKADRIVVIADGHVQEDGSHETLMQAKGAYHKLVMAQCAEIEEIENEAIEPIGVDEMTELFLSQKSSNNGFLGSKSSSLLPIEARDFTEESETIVTGSSLGAVMKYSLPEWWIISIGCLASMITGTVLPIFAIIFGEVVGVLAGEDPEEVQAETNMYSLIFLLLGISAGIATLIQFYTLGIAGETLTMRLRGLMFKAILHQEMSWFDEKENGVGALCARLSGETASVQGAAGQRIGFLLNTATTIILSILVSCYFEWRLALVALSFAPLMVLTIYVEQRILDQEIQGAYDSLQKSTKIAVEAINGIRTVASLGCEKVFHDLYMTELYPYQGRAKRNTHFRGVVYGFSRSLMFFSYAAVMYYGAALVKDEGLSYGYVFIVSEALITCSWSLGNVLVFSLNFSEGLIAAKRIFQLLNRTPKIVDGPKNVKEIWDTGNITYKNTFFSYPNRPPILKGLNLSVLQGKMVALVGPSGCGKSTIVQLLERFYDPIAGSITVGDRGIDEMNLGALRAHLGIVSQEPNLFSKTIAENIAYGDNSRLVSNDEVISAAKQANIHTFIISLPLGYETKLGDKGTQLSGGQKQRIAIARALVRNPKVLLLDEATSALDTESEKMVQEALDNAKVGRTCISIAHRLTTIQDADLICVINHGRIREMGTHTELLNKRGLYYSLYTLQNHK